MAARIATIYSTERRAASPTDMSSIRWFRISAALARLGHDVDIATAEFKWQPRKPVVHMTERLRRVPISKVRWEEYDVVKTLFHRGFETLERRGGASHPFVIAKLGSVVGPRDMDGIYFYGAARRAMYETQARIAERARYVTLLSDPARALWQDCFGTSDDRMLLVPGAADANIPAPGPDPYPADGALRCLFAGNFYEDGKGSQAEAHRSLAAKLNLLGEHLSARGGRLHVIGPGDARSLDPTRVAYGGQVPYERSWDWLRFAHVGVVVSAGPFMHNNESTKIYHYLRVGLPCVSEAGFPNEHVLLESGLGSVVESGDIEALAERAVAAASVSEEAREDSIRYVLQNHTWDVRARVYDDVIRAHARR